MLDPTIRNTENCSYILVYNRKGNYSMLTRVLVNCVICLFFASGCSSDDQVKPLKPIRVATGNWEPLVGQNLPHNGPLAEMMSTILVDLGYVPEFKYYDWPMIEIHLKTGHPSLAFPFIKSKARIDNGFQFSDPLHTFDYVLFYHKNRENEFKSIKSLSDIVDKKLKIGRIRGYAKLSDIPDDTVYTEVSDAGSGFQRLRTNNEESNDNKIDLLLESKTIGLGILESHAIARDINDFAYLGHNGNKNLISKVSLRIMLGPKLDHAVLKKINTAINDHKEFFDNLRAKAVPSNQDIAYLKAPSDKDIHGYFTANQNSAKFIIPRNSKALIIKWNGSFIEYDTHEKKKNMSTPDRSQVKLLNGPFKGRVIWVNNQHIELAQKLP